MYPPSVRYHVLAMALTRTEAANTRNAQFTLLYDEVHPQAWRLALYLCGRREDAEDSQQRPPQHTVEHERQGEQPDGDQSGQTLLTGLDHHRQCERDGCGPKKDFVAFLLIHHNVFEAL